MPEKLKCSICDEAIKKGENVFHTTRGRLSCEGCYNDAWTGASKLIEFKPYTCEKPNAIIFTEDFGELGKGELPDPILREKWISTDAWQGYTDWDLLPGYVKIGNGWVTQFPDETTRRKVELADLFEDLSRGKAIPPCKIWWIFGKTANIFSTSSVIVIREEDKEKIEKWLQEINGGIEGLQEKFD